MKILVTGGAGFLGSHVCEYYRSRGDKVVAYDNLTKHELLRTGYNAGGAREHMISFLAGIGAELIVEDIRHKGKLQEAAKGCDFIIHCAAQPAMTIAREKPGFDAEVNVLGSINVLETARRLGVPVVNISTIHVYGNGINKHLIYGDGSNKDIGEIAEGAEILTGYLTPLHASKRALEIYTRMYIESFNLEAATFRLTGMYGERQFGGEDHGWLANFAIRTVMGLPITVFNINGNETADGEGVFPGTLQSRDMIYVKDVVDAIERWYQGGRPRGLFNIGGGINNLVTLGDCLTMLSRITGTKQEITFKEPRFGDLYYFASDCTKALRAFNWKPTTEIEVGLLRLVNWIKENKTLFKRG